VKALLAGLLLLCATLAQVTVAPLFPLGAATADMPLIAMVVLMLFAGPRALMWGMPVVALWLAFATNRSPGLLILAYLPLVPLGALLEGARLPVNRYAQALLVTLATAGWARLVLSTGAMVHGSGFQPVPLIVDLLLPGALLDAALLTFASIPCRFVGWVPRPMTLQRSGY
jgi:hypothetical protein